MKVPLQPTKLMNLEEILRHLVLSLQFIEVIEDKTFCNKLFKKIISVICALKYRANNM